ncbi:hypothetical protein SAMN02745116_01144 [Pilibacter termitis]|uniref:DUF3806 domain-containing protein n=1 Tax=Pilibacter termitis TaxID=263852 RepID=A0A1T4MLL9_9ENTE|nr:hypothetical protein [Pilibacter termitis]SJZ67747.1 hypothetical protein SAMN02745116_01144 [Pilibacter termitis]
MEDMNEMMKSMAETACEVAKDSGFELDFSEQSLLHVEELLDAFHQKVPKGIKKLFSKGLSNEEMDMLCLVFGAYLGEVVIKNLGGKWQPSERLASVFLDNGTEIYPAQKVYKRLMNGREDEIWAYYKFLQSHIQENG